MNCSAFNLNLLSKYRTPLMGVAAMMIIVCHASGNGVLMPACIKKVLTYGNLGVDIFLFLSGIGCYYSLSKGINASAWYKKRFVRIFIPYALMQIPFWAYRMSVGQFNLVEELWVFSTVDFWIRHVGAWYVALLVPLYILTPYIYIYVSKNGKYSLYKAFSIIILLLVACNLDIDGTSGNLHNVLHNLQWAFSRVPSFIMGMYLAPFVKRGISVNIVWVFLVVAGLLGLYWGVHQFISKEIKMPWCLIPLLLIAFTWILDNLSKDGRFFKFFSWIGVVSLESYLANIYLGGAGTVQDAIGRLPFNNKILYGHYFEYVCVILIGLLLSYIIYEVTKKLQHKRLITRNGRSMIKDMFYENQ